MNNVFISFKNSDQNGASTTDAVLAKQLYAKLVEQNISTFFSNVTLMEFGEAAYKDAIEKALDEAVILVLISNQAEYLNSRWIKYEWSSFHEEILSGDKENGIIIPYLHSSIHRKDRPLAIRNLETFCTDSDPVDKVVEFVKAHLNKLAPPAPQIKLGADKTHSTYNPANHREHSRLKIQAQNTRDADMPAINYVFEQFGGKKVNVLDVGCAYGYVTVDRFRDYENATVYGIDREQKCVDFATEHSPADKFKFAKMDLESRDFVSEMEDYMFSCGIEKFDLIIATLVIHHLTDPVKTLRNLRKFLADDGFIIIRGSDDGSVIAYNDNDLVKKIIDHHLATPGISDRLNGRKIYYQLYTSGYKQIKMMNYVKEISTKDFDERMDVFNERFLYRKNYVANLLKNDPTNMEYRNELEWMEYALSQLEDLFGNDSFWYQETDFVAVARKK